MGICNCIAEISPLMYFAIRWKAASEKGDRSPEPGGQALLAAVPDVYSAEM